MRCAVRLGAVVPGGDVQRVGAGLRRPDARCCLPSSYVSPPSKIVVDREAIDHAERRHRGLHRAQHVEPEARAVLQRAAVFVGAAVLERRVELRDQVAVRGVDFDAVEAGLLARAAPPRRSSPWSARCAPWSSPRGRWSRAWSRRPDAESPTARPAARRRCRCGCGRRRGRAGSSAFAPPPWISRDQPRQARNESVVVDAELAAAMPSGLFRRRHLDGDEADAAAHARHVVGDGLVGDVAFLVRAARRHRRHDDPVRDLDRPDARGGEQDVH